MFIAQSLSLRIRHSLHCVTEWEIFL